jgi:hypothetical protein
MDLPTREESRTQSNSNRCCSPMQPTPSMHVLPSGSSLMPNGKWGGRKEGGGGERGEEMYPPPSPNSDDANDENTGANHSKTHRWDVPPTHHSSVRPAPTKHPTNNWRYHNSNRGGAMTKTSMTSQGAEPSLPKSSPPLLSHLVSYDQVHFTF